MKLVLRIILILVVTSSYITSYGQCSIDQSIPILDLDTTVVSLLISGAENNDLGSADQGVCAVNVKMNHTFIGDIFLELVSPAGQRVRLMGPAVDVSSNTSFVTWDVQFNACAFPAFPDGGYEPIWDNLQTWLGGTTYVGTYYPFEGCLEDLDIGEVDGEWRLEFIDQSQFGTGNFLSFELFFCSTAGVTCNVCDPGQHQLSGEVLDFCQFDPELNFDLPAVFEEAEPASELYNYGYAILQDDIVIEFSPEADLTNYDGGTYTICGVSYQDIDSIDLFQLVTPVMVTELTTVAQVEDICLSLSTDCVTISIATAPPLVLIEEEICVGDSVLVGEIYYSEEGIYPIINQANGCDSVSRVIINVLENPYPLVSDIGTLSCDEWSTNITAVGIPAGEAILWSTADGLIASSDTLATIRAERPGTYTARITSGACIYVESVTVAASADYIDVQIPTGIVTCSNPTVTLAPQVSGAAVDSIVWQSVQPFDQDGFDITVSSGGSFTVSIYTPICTSVRVIDIVEDTDISEFIAVSDTLSCIDLEGELAITPSDEEEYAYAWYQNSAVVGNDSLLEIVTGGFYEQIVTAPNGCTDTFAFDVIQYSGFQEFELLFDPLNCVQTSTVLDFSSTIPEEEIVSISWTDPALSIFATETLEIDQPGTYNLLILAEGGCRLDTTFEVTGDFEPRDITIDPATFECNVDSIQLNLEGTFPGDTILWIGPSFSLEEDPWIQQPGLYRVFVTSTNGCTVEDMILVGNSTTLPDITFEYGELDCVSDSVIIYPSDIGTYQYDWTLLDGVSIVAADSLVVFEPGVYEVRISDGVNDCYNTVPITVVKNETGALTSVVANPITCSESTSQVTITTSNFIENFQWFDPTGLPIDVPIEPSFTTIGLYRISYDLDNGCSGSDSVEVVALQEIPSIEVTDGFIDCMQLTTTSFATVTNATEYEVVWTAPDNSTLTGDSIDVSLPGIYQAIVIAQGDCRDTAVATISGDIDGPEVTLVLESNITCLQPTVALYAELEDDNVDLLWNGANILQVAPDTLAVSTPGLHTLTVTDENGCKTLVGIIVETEVVEPIYSTTTNMITCQSPEVTIEVIPEAQGYTIVWEDPSLTGFSESVSDGGQYIFSISNLEGCIAIDTIVVLQDTLVPAPIIDQSNLLNCTFDEATLTIANTQTTETYLWNGPGVVGVEADSITIDQEGVYTLIASAETGCSDTTILDIEYNLTIPDLVIIGDAITCEAGKSIISASAELEIEQYLWTGPNGYLEEGEQILVFEEGTYYLEAVAINGCASIDSIVIEDLQVFPEIEVEDYYLRCDGKDLKVIPSTITTGATVRWFGPNGLFVEEAILSINTAGQYIGVALNDEGCAGLDTFSIIDEVILPEFEVSVDLLNCYGPAGLIASNTSDDSTIVWTGPEGTTYIGSEVDVEVPGAYQLIVMGTNACSDTVALEVIDGRSSPIASIEQLTVFQCLTKSVLLEGTGTDAIGGVSYQWSTTEGAIVSSETTKQIEVIGGGIYSLVVRDQFTGCTDSVSYLLVQEEQSFSDFEFDILPPSCLDFANASIEFTSFVGGFSPYEVVVDGNAYGATSEVLYLYAGEHSITITDSLGCEVSKEIDIAEGDYPSVTLPADTIISIGDSVLVDAMITPAGQDLLIEWNTLPPCEMCTSFWIQPFTEVYYEITVSNEAGCSSMADMLISVNDADAQRLPNIFSPNGDNLNDLFYVPYENGIDKIDYFRIYDWNGALVYSANDIVAGDESSGWDGMFNGQPALTGVYIYQVGITLISGKTIPLVGDVTLVR